MESQEALLAEVEVVEEVVEGAGPEEGPEEVHA